MRCELNCELNCEQAYQTPTRKQLSFKLAIFWGLNLLLCLGADPFLGYASDRPLEERVEARVGVLLPLSGPYAAVGKDCQLGINIAVHEKASLAKIRFNYEDVQAEPKLAVAGFRKLVDSDGVSAVLAVRGPVGMAVNPLSAEKQILLLGAVGHSGFAKSNPYAVQFWTTGSEEGVAMARLLAREGRQQIALFTAEDDWLQSVSDGLRGALSGAGSRLVFDQSFAGTESDFQALASKALAKQPDAIVINVSISQLGVLSKRLREQGYTGRLLGNFWFAKPQVLEAAGAAAEGVSFVEMNSNHPQFLDGAKRIGKSERPSAMVYSCYCAANYLAQLIAAGVPPREKMLEAIGRINSISLADGALSIEDRRAKFEIVTKTVRQGEIVDN